MTTPDWLVACAAIAAVAWIIGFVTGCTHAGRRWRDSAVRHGYVLKNSRPDYYWVNGDPVPPMGKD